MMASMDGAPPNRAGSSGRKEYHLLCRRRRRGWSNPSRAEPLPCSGRWSRPLRTTAPDRAQRAQRGGVAERFRRSDSRERESVEPFGAARKVYEITLIPVWSASGASRSFATLELRGRPRRSAGSLAEAGGKCRKGLRTGVADPRIRHRPMDRSERVIVLVDDDLDIREALTDVLKDRGFRVRTAANGAEALTLLRGLTAPPSAIPARSDDANHGRVRFSR